VPRPTHVKLDVGGGAMVTASITNEAADELKLANEEMSRKKNPKQSTLAWDSLNCAST
jgi:hypothetical protein